MSKQLIVEMNCGRGRLIFPQLLQIPIWMTVSLALRRMCTGMVPTDVEAPVC